MNKLIVVIVTALIAGCSTPREHQTVADFDLEMSSIVAEHVTQPRADIGATRTFYRISRGACVIDISASDLVAALEKHAEESSVADDTLLATRVRKAIADGVSVLDEKELHLSLSDRVLYVLADVFCAGAYRVVQGAEEGSSLVVGEYSFGRRGHGSTFAGGGVVFFWSKSRTQIFSVNYWIT